MIAFIRSLGRATFLRCEGYSDYYDNLPGGSAPRTRCRGCALGREAAGGLASAD